MPKEHIDLTPTWAFAAQVHIEILRNPHTTDEAKATAATELMRLAYNMDTIIEAARSGKVSGIFEALDEHRRTQEEQT